MKLSIDPRLEKELPSGWFLNYCNIYQFKQSSSGKNSKPSIFSQNSISNAHQNLMKSLNRKPNNQQNNANNPNKKVWACLTYYKLAKKFEEFTAKPLDEPKETDSAEVKEEFIKAKNLIHRMRRHLF